MEQFIDDNGEIHTVYDKYDVLYNVLMKYSGEMAGLSNVGHIWWRREHSKQCPGMLGTLQIIRLKGSYDLGEIHTSIARNCIWDVKLYIDESNQYIMYEHGDRIGCSEVLFDKNQSRELMINNFDVFSKIVLNYFIPLIGVSAKSKPYALLSNGRQLFETVNGYYLDYPNLHVVYDITLRDFLKKFSEVELTINDSGDGLKTTYR